MACRRFSFNNSTACGLLLIPLLLLGLFVLLGSPSADHVGAQEVGVQETGAKQAYLSGQRPAEAPRSSANAAATNQSAKPSGKMGFVPASPTPREYTAKPPRSVANPVARRAVPQPPKYAVSAGAAPEAPRVPKSDTRSVASRPVQQPRQQQPVAVAAQPQPKPVANEAVATTSPASVPAPASKLAEPVAESLPLMEEGEEEQMETTVVESRPTQFRTLDDSAEEEMPLFDEPADVPVPPQNPTLNVVQSFFDDDVADETSDELMVPDEEPILEAKREEESHPVVTPRDVAQQTPSSPNTRTDRPTLREVGGKQSYSAGQRSTEAPRGSANHASTNQATKPSNKLNFTPASPSNSEGVARNPRSVANPLARRTVPQPPKYAASAPPAPRQSEQPQLPTETLAPPPSLAKTATSPTRPVEAPVFEEPVVKRSEKGVVQLYFDEEPADEGTDEILEVDRPSTPAARTNDVRHVAAQGESTQGTPQVQPADQDVTPALTEKDRMSKIMSELRPVREVDIRLAVQLPMAGKNDSDKVREPDDQALAILRHRKPFSILPVSREPWMASRDSYPFFHKPLWFEDPNLERCGRGSGLFTTAVSAVHFSANIPILPYRFTAEKPWSCVRTLPDCTVCEKFGPEAYLPPWSLSAAAVQAAATVGIIYLVP